MGGLVSDTEEEGDEDMPVSQAKGSQGTGKGRIKRVATGKNKVLRLILQGATYPDE